MSDTRSITPSYQILPAFNTSYRILEASTPSHTLRFHRIPLLTPLEALISHGFALACALPPTHTPLPTTSRPATPLVHFWGAGREREGIAGAQTGRVLLRGAWEHAEEIRLKPVDAFLHPHADALPELLVRQPLCEGEYAQELASYSARVRSLSARLISLPTLYPARWHVRQANKHVRGTSEQTR
jgi:hypothetical protein